MFSRFIWIPSPISLRKELPVWYYTRSPQTTRLLSRTLPWKDKRHRKTDAPSNRRVHSGHPRLIGCIGKSNRRKNSGRLHGNIGTIQGDVTLGFRIALPNVLFYRRPPGLIYGSRYRIDGILPRQRHWMGFETTEIVPTYVLEIFSFAL